jgi:hypothetical protein
MPLGRGKTAPVQAESGAIAEGEGFEPSSDRNGPKRFSRPPLTRRKPAWLSGMPKAGKQMGNSTGRSDTESDHFAAASPAAGRSTRPRFASFARSFSGEPSFLSGVGASRAVTASLIRPLRSNPALTLSRDHVLDSVRREEPARALDARSAYVDEEVDSLAAGPIRTRTRSGRGGHKRRSVSESDLIECDPIAFGRCLSETLWAGNRLSHAGFGHLPAPTRCDRLVLSSWRSPY